MTVLLSGYLRGFRLCWLGRASSRARSVVAGSPTAGAAGSPTSSAAVSPTSGAAGSLISGVAGSPTADVAALAVSSSRGSGGDCART